MAVLGGGAFTQLIVHDGQGIWAHDVNIQAAGATGIWQLFASGKAPAMATTLNWALDARNAGAKIKIYRSDIYFPSMAQAIASDAMIQKRPELIRNYKLVRATLKGMEDIMKEGAGVVPDYIAAVPQMKGKEDFVAEVISLYNDYVYKGQPVIGAMDRDRLAQVQKFYVSQDIVAKESSLVQLYTNQFVQ